MRNRPNLEYFSFKSKTSQLIIVIKSSLPTFLSLSNSTVLISFFLSIYRQKPRKWQNLREGHNEKRQKNVAPHFLFETWQGEFAFQDDKQSDSCRHGRARVEVGACMQELSNLWTTTVSSLISQTQTTPCLAPGRGAGAVVLTTAPEGVTSLHHLYKV